MHKCLCRDGDASSKSSWTFPVCAAEQPAISASCDWRRARIQSAGFRVAMRRIDCARSGLDFGRVARQQIASKEGKEEGRKLHATFVGFVVLIAAFDVHPTRPKQRRYYRCTRKWTSANCAQALQFRLHLWRRACRSVVRVVAQKARKPESQKAKSKRKKQ